jgi:hypothetical protein
MGRVCFVKDLRSEGSFKTCDVTNNQLAIFVDRKATRIRGKVERKSHRLAVVVYWMRGFDTFLITETYCPPRRPARRFQVRAFDQSGRTILTGNQHYFLLINFSLPSFSIRVICGLSVAFLLPSLTSAFLHSFPIVLIVVPYLHSPHSRPIRWKLRCERAPYMLSSRPCLHHTGVLSW